MPKRGRIFKRGQIFSISYYHRGHEHRESSHSEKESDARALLKYRLAECGADTLGLRKFIGPSAERLTMTECFDALETDFRLRGIKSLRQSLSHLKAARREFGRYRAVEITPMLVDQWYERQRGGENGLPDDRQQCGPSVEISASAFPVLEMEGNNPWGADKKKVAEICGSVENVERCGENVEKIMKGQTNDSKGNRETNRVRRNSGTTLLGSVGTLGDRPATGDPERTERRWSNSGGTGVLENPNSAPQPATLNRVVSMVSQALSLAAKRQRIAAAPLLRKLSEAGNARQGFLAPADFEALVAQLPDHLQDFTRFAYLTGWRLGAIRSLVWEDVELGERTIRLRPEHDKAGTGLVIPLEGEWWEIIERRKAQQAFEIKASKSIKINSAINSMSKFIFLRERKKTGEARLLALEGEVWEIVGRQSRQANNGIIIAPASPKSPQNPAHSEICNLSPVALFTMSRVEVSVPTITNKNPKKIVSTNQIGQGSNNFALSLSSFIFHHNGNPFGDFRKAWATALAKAGLAPGIHFHDLRRSAVRNMRLAGVDPDVIMRLVGHKTQSMLTRYNITDLEDLRQAQHKVQNHLAAQSPVRNLLLMR